MQRCDWANVSQLSQEYHDNEWGKPVYDDRKLFENLCLEGAQAGLSWNTILTKRKGYRQAFAQFDIKQVASFDDAKLAELLENSNIVRHRLKIQSVIKNAKLVLQIQQEVGSFSDFIWQFTEHKPIVNHWKNIQEVPSETLLSQTMSKALKKRGFSFVGAKICYSFMQASGLVDDHLLSCHCKK